jgi:hypothetical protein
MPAPLPHVIRLRGPWELVPLARTVLAADGTSRDEPGELPPPARTDVPADWGPLLGSGFRGRARYLRRFNRPTNLAAGDRVLLVVEGVDAWAAAALNGAELGTISLGELPVRFDITPHLRPRNELSIDVELPRLTAESPPLARADRGDLPGGLIGEVRLEILARP